MQTSDSAPDLLNALQDELGLRMELSRSQTEVIVIDNAVSKANLAALESIYDSYRECSAERLVILRLWSQFKTMALILARILLDMNRIEQVGFDPHNRDECTVGCKTQAGRSNSFLFDRSHPLRK